MHLSTGQPAEQERAHDAPAKSGAECDRLVDLLRGRHPVVDEVQRLAPDRFEETIGNEGVDLRVEHQGVHADRPVRGGGPLLRLHGGGLAADHLDEGQQVDGDEGVAHHDAFRPRAVGLEAAREEARGRGSDDRITRRGAARGGEEGALHLLALGHALLDESGARDRFLEGLRNLDPAGQGGRGEGKPGVGAGRVLQHVVDPAPGARVGVPDADVDAVHREARRPSGSDHPGPEEGDPPDLTHLAALELDAIRPAFQSDPAPAGPVRGFPSRVHRRRGCASYRAMRADRNTRAPARGGACRSNGRARGPTAPKEPHGRRSVEVVGIGEIGRHSLLEGLGERCRLPRREVEADHGDLGGGARGPRSRY